MNESWLLMKQGFKYILRIWVVIKLLSLRATQEELLLLEFNMKQYI